MARAIGAVGRTFAAIPAFIRLGRPIFLGGGFILFALGAAVAARSGHVVSLARYLMGQAVVTAFQLMTHYANDYFDYEADCANRTPTRWSGGSRVLPAGALPRRVALHAAWVLAALGLLTAAALARRPDAGPLVMPLALVMGALSWGYSAPPLRLCARGLGELDVAVVVTGLVPLFGFYVQAPDGQGLGRLALALIAPFCLQIAMILAINFPDAAGDRATGKRTLVVRLGVERAAPLYRALTALPYPLLPIALAAGLPPLVAIAAALPAPLALWRIWQAGDHHRAERWERATFWAVALLMSTSIAELVAFGVGAR